MPLLPRNNSLDYNPDATINASKKITSIALERMKNPLEDPDFATLSTLNAQRSLGDSMERLESLAGRYHSLVLRLGNLLTVDERRIKEQRENTLPIGEDLGAGRKGRKKGGSKKGEYDAMFPSSSSSSVSGFSNFSDLSDYFRRQPQPLPRDLDAQQLLRLLAEQARQRRISSSSSSAGSTIDPREYNRRLQADRSRFSQFYQDDDRNSSAISSTPASSIYPYDDASEPYIDDDDLSSVSRSTRPRMEMPDYDPNYGVSFARPMPKNIAEVAGANFNSLIFPLIQLTREMNMILNSKVKPAIVGLTGSQVSRLNDIYKMVRTSYNDVIFPSGRRARLQDPFTRVRNVNIQGIPANRRRQDDFEEAIIENNQFGDEILGTWNEERKNLLLNLTIVVNSWKQNTPTGQQTEFAGDITASYQNTATRLGKKAELVEAVGEMPESWRETGYTYGDLQDLESVGREQDYRAYQDAQSVGSGRKPRGRPRKKDTMMMTMVGSGRNFYGEQINDSRDIPTIWRSYRDCPTKYLL